jgi:thiol-disulfide isomerase/thioredoxin
MFVGLALAVGLVSPGCGNAAAPAQSSGDQAIPPMAPSTVKDITLQILDYDRIQKLIASHHGQVVVVDCWATSCPPCVEEFPKLVALHKRNDTDRLACISLSLDFEGLGKPEDVAHGVMKFLVAQNATFENILSSEPSDVLLKKLNLPSIPAVFVYGPDGKLAQRFEGSKAYDEVPALVRKLLEGT